MSRSTRPTSQRSFKVPDPAQTSFTSSPLAAPTPTQPAQILMLMIRASATINNTKTPDGKIWRKALDILQDWEGFRAFYWGRRVEEEDCEQVEVVVFRDKLEQHYAFLGSSQFDLLKSLLVPLWLTATATATASPPKVRVLHAHLQDFTRNARTLHGAPVTGTAIYTATSIHGWEKAWALWTTIVPGVKGCLGCTGGWIVESPPETDTDGEGGDGERQSGVREYVVFVGWESIEDHDAYHHMKDFARKRVVLSLHNNGWRGYGHVRFATCKL